MENHGTAFADRWKVLEERIEAMKACWTRDESSYHGRHVDFDDIWSWPKPVQKPHPPIIMGAASPWGRERVARYCDGWVPLPAQMKNIAAELQDLEERLVRHGRKLSDIEISFFWAPTNVDQLKRYRDLGVHRAILACPADSRDATLALLDSHAELMAAVGH
jgi:alkanesulfonate monooxygenase SsuD/methylene tetrahydromethanopterin reductase-like flavin-dependent oxidoreductase (luciferase family)